MAYQGILLYTIVLVNSGGKAGSSALLPDTLPINTTFSFWGERPVEAVANVDELTWSGTVFAGGVITFTFPASHTADYSDVVNSTVTYKHNGNADSAEATFHVMGWSYAF